MSKKFKKRLLIAVVIIAVLAFFLNAILESVLKNIITTQLDVINAEKVYTLGIDDVDIHILRGSASISGLYSRPTEAYMTSFKSGEEKDEVLNEFYASKVELDGLGIYKLLFGKELIIDRIELDDFHFNFYRPEKIHQVEAVQRDEKPKFSLDSIRVPGINKIELGEMIFEDYGIHIIDVTNNDTIFSYDGKEFLFSGLKMKAIEESEGYFTFDNSNLELNLEKQEFNISSGLYAISFDKFNYRYANKELQIINFGLEPTASLEEFSARFNNAFDVNTATIDTLTVSGFDTRSMLRSGVINIDQIVVNGLEAKIFKDKTKPFDTQRVVSLPQKGIENMGQPLHIAKVNLQNSSLIYSETIPNKKELLTVSLENINGEISYITSIRDSLKSKKDLEVKLEASFLNLIPLSVNLTMPYLTKNQSFYCSGYTKGATNFERLNSILFPVLDMKFKNGSFDGMSFNIQGNDYKSSGNLTLLYTDLEVEIFNKKNNESKAISWLANSVVKRSNPNKQGKTTVSEVGFERTRYKGLGNYLWKSVQSGIVNSLVPFGKRKKKK